MDNCRRMLICTDNFDNMMTGIYEAWAYERDGYEIEILTGENQMYSLFCECCQIETDSDKADKVVRTIRRKLGTEIFQYVYRAAMHADSKRTEVIFRFLKKGFAMGRSVAEDFSDPWVLRLLELSRKVWNEAQKYKGVLRFQEIYLESGEQMLLSCIEPKSNVLTLLAEHFADRLPIENWLIWDKARHSLAVHPRGCEWFLREGLEQQEEQAFLAEEEDAYSKLWNIFCQTIGIENRYNPKCQDTMLPKWYRRHMTEFQ